MTTTRGCARRQGLQAGGWRLRSKVSELWEDRMMQGKLVNLLVAMVLGLASAGFAADHGDAPLVSLDRAVDLGDTYVFLDPRDNTKLILAMTTQGFIVPGEAVNFSIFDHQVWFQFELETQGGALADQVITISFSRKQGSSDTPQTATIRMPDGSTFQALTTVSTLDKASPKPVVTVDQRTGVAFFAGEVDDPFFFDVPGFSRFVSSVLDRKADPGQLARGRDTFAGYNTLAIALSVPVQLLGNPVNNIVGVNARAQRLVGNTLVPRDRSGLPTVNTALVPFRRKDEYNQASTQDDAQNRFAGDIVATLQALGTNADRIALLAQLAVTQGDFLRVDLGIPNQGPGSGTNPEAAFPNGRRLADDVIDAILSIVTNGAVTTGDNVNRNERKFRNHFPFFAKTHQPFAPGAIDDRTRN